MKFKLPFADPDEVHIINPLWDASGGSEWRSMNLYTILSRVCKVSLWTEFKPDPSLTEQFPIRRIKPRKLRFPKTGVFIFVGVYFNIGGWVKWARPRRIIIVFNTLDYEAWNERKRFLAKYCRKPIETVYACREMRQDQNNNDIVEHSPIDIERFSMAVPERISPDGQFIIGRLSRDNLLKHHEGDISFYRKLAAQGIVIKIMGGTCLSPDLRDVENVELLPACALDAVSFMHSINCFYYRTAPEYYEAYGRVVLEAMACGLPVVCENRGGYNEFIEHGVNGFKFDTEKDAYEILMNLKNNPELRMNIGRVARITIEKIYSESYLSRLIEHYRQ
ncbi:MAG: glycosyltransferase family 4 protein [Oryzomonas sp.]|uniref:glycosyltransferase family 4 protein n=1 Tax=Oryzomonas sp. TaxID=2855186 RepID=UPI0028521D4D|nr:glycosyltransferase family 4 protein [Oryzomonas sp.]MDR3580101.1 glycosyltransferase family 4 protein [Oryzomonas sp.]